MRLEVGNADQAGPAVAVELLQGLPGGHVVAVVARRAAASGSGTGRCSRSRARPASPRRPTGVIRAVAVVAQLGGDEQAGRGPGRTWRWPRRPTMPGPIWLRPRRRITPGKDNREGKCAGPGGPGSSGSRFSRLRSLTICR